MYTSADDKHQHTHLQEEDLNHDSNINSAIAACADFEAPTNKVKYLKYFACSTQVFIFTYTDIHTYVTCPQIYMHTILIYVQVCTNTLYSFIYTKDVHVHHAVYQDVNIQTNSTYAYHVHDNVYIYTYTY